MPTFEKISTMNYKDLADDSRVWIYQSSRELTAEEVREIKSHGNDFINSWAAHGTELKAAIEIFYNRFIVLFADETQVKASGCSIDSSVHFMQKIQDAYQLDLFDRLNIAFKVSNKIDALRMNDFQEALEKGRLTENTTVFNNLVESKVDFENNWEVPLKDSWHKQLMA